MQNDNSQAKTVAPTPEFVKEEQKNREEPASAPKTVKDHRDDADRKRVPPTRRS